MRRSLFSKSVLTVICAFVALFAQAQSFTVDAPNVVSAGEVFQIVYTVNADVDSFNPPALSGLTLLAGPTSSRMQSYSNVNGKSSSSLEVSYTLVVRSSSEGKAKVGQASVQVNGKTISCRALDIDVVASANQSGGNQSTGQSGRQSQDNDSYQSQNRSSNGTISDTDAFLSLNLSRTSVVKGEPIVATLKLYIKNVNIAGFEDVKFPVFNGFWSQELEVPQNINFTRENYNGQIYNSAVLRKWVLLPQKTGSISIDPAELVCQFQVRVGSGRRSMFDDFFSDSYQLVKKRLFTRQSTIAVKNLPSPAPADFGGGVGQMQMKVTLGRDSIPAHEAGSITVELSGSGNLNLLEAPKVSIPADFEQYDVKTTNNYSNGAAGMTGSKTFEFPFIPRSEGTFEIPAVTYSYYDTKAGKYVTLSSGPLSIKVTKGSATGGSAVISGVSKQAVANLGSDIRYISNASPRFFSRDSMFIGKMLFFLCILLLVVLTWFTDRMLSVRARLRGDVRRRANRRANKVATARLKQASGYLAKDLGSAFYEELHKTLLGYISDKLAIKFSDMQRDTIVETLEAHKVEKEDIDKFILLLNDCEMARYSSASAYEKAAMNAQYTRAVELISSFESEL